MARHWRNPRFVRAGMNGGVGVVALLAGVAAAAQEPAGPAPAAAATDAPGASAGAIVVTGSRIARSGFTAPTPVTVVGQERLEQRAITNVGDALNELPSFRPLVTPLTQQAVGGNIGARTLDPTAIDVPA